MRVKIVKFIRKIIYINGTSILRRERERERSKWLIFGRKTAILPRAKECLAFDLYRVLEVIRDAQTSSGTSRIVLAPLPL